MPEEITSNKTTLTSFYENVKSYVKDNTSLTLRSFIESLGINYDSYNGQKRYNNLPRLNEAIKIASALGVTVETLCNGSEIVKTESMPMKNGKINYAHLVHSVDVTNPEDVVDKIKGFLTHRELAPEQILFGLGLILDKNKEAYITSLKQDLTEMKHQLNEVVNENNKFRERLNKAEKNKAQYPLKKRVVIVRKKESAE